MKKRRQFRFKINGDTMTTIVVVSLILCVIFVVTGFWFAWNDKDVSAIVSSALLCFGTELGICGLMKIFDRNNAIRDKELEENKRRAEARKERMNRNG